MKKTILLTTAAFGIALLLSAPAWAQLSFTSANNLLSVASRSGCAVTVVDVNNDGMDDILRLDQGHLLNLDLQTRSGVFTNYFITDIGGGSAWAMTTADVDHNGWKDVIADGTGGIRLVKIFENAGNISATNTLLTNSGFFLQNATFADLNNDGWIDLFCCDDNAAAKMYLNDGTGNLVFSTMIDFAVNPTVTYNGDPADSGNYGSAWIDFDNDGDLDLYVAHCRQSSTNPADLRRINRLFVNDGSNNFTEQGAAYGVDIGWQTWTSSFGDIDNDGDLDLLLTNHDYVNQMFENDGTGHYTELTTSGLANYNITPIESKMEDFDNDGFIDIMIAGSEWLYFHNNGNKTFTRVTGLMASNGMLSFGTGDLNHDGFVDLFTSYGDIYQAPSPNFDDVLYLNDKNANNFITFSLEGTVSNKGAIGGRATIYGPWGIQIREVRAGESYGTCNSSQLHFGLGQATAVDSAVIWFPSGNTTTLYNLVANQFVTVVENGCTITGNVIPGPYILCTGQTLNLNAASGFSSYLWNDGSSNASISVSLPGSFNVLVTDGSGCTNLSPTVNVLLNPDETPIVAVTGEETFCEGGAAVLQSSPAAAYTWSNGSSTQAITVTQTGIYTVTIQGVCGTFTSSAVNITVLDAVEPIGTGASGPSPSSVVLSATGTNLEWYDQQTGGTLLGTGPTYTTPVLNNTTTYWVQATSQYPGVINYTGQTYHEGTLYSGGNNTNGSVDFDALAPFILNSVKVYTDTPGNREILLLDGGGTIINSLLVNIPVDSTRITLNFNVPVGQNYSLTTNAAVNTATLGTVTPRLQRSSQGTTYPYEIQGLVSLTGSNQGNSYYYYFYDWEVQMPSYDCVSDRVPVVADITTGLNPVASGSLISVYPNPASGSVQVQLSQNHAAHISLVDVTGRIIRERDLPSGPTGLVTFDLNGIASGTYSIRVQTGDGDYVNKLVVN